MPTVLYRKYPDIDDKFQRYLPCLPSDYALWMLLAEKGLIYKINESMAVYRCGSGMWSTSHAIKNDMAYLSTLNRLYATITNGKAKKNIQKQIRDITESIVHIEHDLNQIRFSKAYRLGKILLRPFKWLRK
jgi:hypothetical protein